MGQAARNLTNHLASIGKEIEEKATMETMLNRLDVLMTRIESIDDRLIRLENELRLDERRGGRVKELEYELERLRYEQEEAKAYEAHLMTRSALDDREAVIDAALGPQGPEGPRQRG